MNDNYLHRFTKTGSLKDQTECAPNNGYYFLPLYDKGEYILKVIFQYELLIEYKFRFEVLLMKPFLFIIRLIRREVGALNRLKLHSMLMDLPMNVAKEKILILYSKALELPDE